MLRQSCYQWSCYDLHYSLHILRKCSSTARFLGTSTSCLEPPMHSAENRQLCSHYLSWYLLVLGFLSYISLFLMIFQLLFINYFVHKLHSWPLSVWPCVQVSPYCSFLPAFKVLPPHHHVLHCSDLFLSVSNISCTSIYLASLLQFLVLFPRHPTFVFWVI